MTFFFSFLSSRGYLWRLCLLLVSCLTNFLIDSVINLKLVVMNFFSVYAGNKKLMAFARCISRFFCVNMGIIILMSPFEYM